MTKRVSQLTSTLESDRTTDAENSHPLIAHFHQLCYDLDARGANIIRLRVVIRNLGIFFLSSSYMVRRVQVR